MPDPPRPGRRRWAAARGASLVFLALALTFGGGLYLFRAGDAPPAATIPLPQGPRPAANVGPPPSGEAAPESGLPQEEGGPDPGPTGSPERGGRAGAPEEDQGGFPSRWRPENPGDGGSGRHQERVFIHLTGAVASPGVMEVPAGSRLFQVLELAGGATRDADLAAVNLAAVVTDGGQVHVPAVGEAVPPEPVPPGGTGSGPDAPAGSVDLNTADAAALEELPRVGPVLAERIIAWRVENGPFASTADLDAVPGIGPALLEALLPLVVVR